MSETCETCKFWLEFPRTEENREFRALERGALDPLGEDNHGECHRYPPAIDHAIRYFPGIIQEEPTMSLVEPLMNLDCRWPSTISGDWCGEYQPKANP